MKKSNLCLWLCIVMVLTMLVGCGKNVENETEVNNQENQTSPVTSDEAVVFPLDEPVTMSMGIYQVAGTDVTKTLTLTEMEKRTNIMWDYRVLGEDRDEKLPLEFGGGEYHDVYLRSGLSNMAITQYANEGIVIPLNDVIDKYMPNLKARLDERNLWGFVTSDDGNIYSLPQIGELTTGMLMFVNKPWMEKLNIEEPKNIEEFIDMLRRFKEEDPNGNGEKDELPLILCADMLSFLPQYFGIANDVMAGSMATYENGKVDYYPASEEYKEYLKILQTLVEEGLVNSDYEAISWQDQESITMTGDTVGCFIHWGGYLGVGPDRDEDFPGLTPLEESKMVVSSGFESGGLVITDKCENPELVAQWADYFYSDEGSKLAWMGIEGETYELADDEEYFWKTDGNWGDNQTSILSSATLMGHSPIPVYVPPIYNAGNQNPDEIFLWKQRKIAIEHGVDPFPILTWSENEITERATYLADIHPYIDQYRASVVAGEQDLDSTWDEYVSTLNNMQLSRLVEIDQKAYEAFLNKAE